MYEIIYSPLFEGDATGLKCFSSDVPARDNAMSLQIAQFNMQSEFFE